MYEACSFPEVLDSDDNNKKHRRNHHSFIKYSSTRTAFLDFTPNVNSSSARVQLFIDTRT